MQFGQPVELCLETEGREQATAALDHGNVCTRTVYPRETAGNIEWAGEHSKCVGCVRRVRTHQVDGSVMNYRASNGHGELEYDSTEKG